MNVYLYNMPEDFKRTAPQFTSQYFYWVVVHTTEGLLREMTADIQMMMQRQDVTRWYSRKDCDSQYQIKAGEVLGRLSEWKKTINIAKYMDIKVVYKQQHRKAIEEKVEYKQNHFHDYSIITTNTNLDDNYEVKMTMEIFTQTKKRQDENNPGHHNKFFLFLVQHYPHRLEHIFKQAGASPEDYHQ
eukprot:6471630-Amphidinium_carterae.1